MLVLHGFFVGRLLGALAGWACGLTLVCGLVGGVLGDGALIIFNSLLNPSPNDCRHTDIVVAYCVQIRNVRFQLSP